MTELDIVETKIARNEQLSKVTSVLGGIGLAGLYFWWQYVFNHWIATYTWMIPFVIGFAIPRLVFTLREHRLDQERRRLLDLPTEPPALPEARAVHVPAPAPVAGPEIVMPGSGEGDPTFLK